MAGIYGEAGHHALVINGRNARAAPTISAWLRWGLLGRRSRTSLDQGGNQSQHHDAITKFTY